MGNNLHVGEAFGQFLDAPMEVPQIRRRFDDPFSVQLEFKSSSSRRFDEDPVGSERNNFFSASGTSLSMCSTGGSSSRGIKSN
jgi:hypothetical protein